MYEREDTFNLYYNTTAGSLDNVTDETYNQLMIYAINTLAYMLKTPSSLDIRTYMFVFTEKSNGKHKYDIYIQYSATNAYGGVVDGLQHFQYNHKLKETAGSLMTR